MSNSVTIANTLMLQSHEGERAVLLAGWKVVRLLARGLMVQAIRAVRLLPGPYSVD